MLTTQRFVQPTVLLSRYYYFTYTHRVLNKSGTTSLFIYHTSFFLECRCFAVGPTSEQYKTNFTKHYYCVVLLNLFLTETPIKTYQFL